MDAKNIQKRIEKAKDDNQSEAHPLTCGDVPRSMSL